MASRQRATAMTGCGQATQLWRKAREREEKRETEKERSGGGVFGRRRRRYRRAQPATAWTGEEKGTGELGGIKRFSNLGFETQMHHHHHRNRRRLRVVPATTSSSNGDSSGKGRNLALGLSRIRSVVAWVRHGLGWFLRR